MSIPFAHRSSVRAIVAVALVLAVAGAILYHLYGLPFSIRRFGVVYYRIDVDVYRLGGGVYHSGGDLYGLLPRTELGTRLPFTYPPFAAILFAPMAMLPLSLVNVVTTGLSIAALAGAVALTLRSLDVRGGGWTAALVLVALTLEPVHKTLDYGQVNLLLMCVVLADCLPRRTPWPRGLLIGLVAAFKLTPAVFVLYFLVRKDFRAAMWSGIGFAAATALGFVFASHDSARYWTSVLFDSDRIGTPAYPANQSVVGMLARLGQPDLRTPLWLLLSAAALALTVVGMRAAFAAGLPSLALSLTAVAGLLMSPVSWSHHWVWAVPLLLSLVVAAHRHSDLWLFRCAAAGLALFWCAPHWPAAHRNPSGLHLSAVDQLLSASYLWWGLTTVAIVAVRFRPESAPVVAPPVLARPS